MTRRYEKTGIGIKQFESIESYNAYHREYYRIRRKNMPLKTVSAEETHTSV
jgi:hypothetical protein